MYQYGFDEEILAEKRANYDNKVQFRAQYYNDPNDPEEAGITREFFQYYDPIHLARQGNSWFVGDRKLNVCASIDFAYSTSKKSDYTTIAVVGADYLKNYFILDLARFKTGQPKEYFDQILRLYDKWNFNKLYAEATGAQVVIINALKNDYIRPQNLALAIEEENPTRHQGTKEERIQNILQPKYANRQMWHYRGGNCQTLEEELLLSNPAHDDLKDALSVAVDKLICPSRIIAKQERETVYQYVNKRFGGIS